ncbi:Six-bladed beta-propeller, TolB-like protein [Corchorus olitorius]|uniref:Six-bladed beta-propeller, TolB-like protein n=1 Tax=Corchorus olitorius TaxID=93759 RepID=A0A1R3HPB2_9ROSI|nr:Six-bladed beta-propeller, TolB-like protein [Corchorus olitorius]
MKKSHSFKFLLLVFFLLAQNIMHSHQRRLEEGGGGGDIQRNYYQIDLPDQVLGPESIAFDCRKEGPYIGVSDGRILKWQGPNLGWKEFAIPSSNRDRKLCDGSSDPNLEPTCGRPLGLKFNHATCQLYIADAYFGLLMVGPNGGVAQQLANSAEGIPFKFTNALDIDSNSGVIYFTDSSIFIQRRNYVMSAIMFDRTGRLLKYDPETKKVTVIYKGLGFPNGLALSKDNSFLILAETTKMRILKFRLDSITSTNSYVPEEFAKVSRIADNIKRNEKGEFWVGLNSERGRIQNHDVDYKAKLLIGDWVIPDPVGVKYDEEGNILQQLDGNGGSALNSVSEIEEFNGKLYIGSVEKPYVGIFA